MRQELVADEASAGYETEFSAFVADQPLVTFKSWLVQHAKPMSDDLVTVEPTHDDWEPPPGF